MAKPTPGTWRAPAASSRVSGSSGDRAAATRDAGIDRTRRRVCAAIGGALLAGGGGALGASTPVGGTLPGVAPDIARRLARLDPERVGPDDVRDVLAHVPAPRIIALQGSVALVTMEPFAEFLVAMGYPRPALRQPARRRAVAEQLRQQ